MLGASALILVHVVDLVFKKTKIHAAECNVWRVEVSTLGGTAYSSTGCLFMLPSQVLSSMSHMETGRLVHVSDSSFRSRGLATNNNDI